jgi:thioredoxin-dependent peroxiredoxin
MTTVLFKGTPVHLEGKIPEEGSKAPDFYLIDTELKGRKLSDFKGKKKLLIVVPSLDTGVCMLSSKKFNQLLKEQKKPAIALVISADLPFAQKRTCGQEGLDSLITLSTMSSRDFAKNYGILIQEGPLAGLCARSIFILDEQDRIIYREIVSELTHEPNYETAMRALTACSCC